MKRQPSFRSQESPRPPVPGTMPVTGTNPSLGLERDAVLLKNPIEPTKASLAKGKRLFEIYCTPCHGVIGKGDGPVAAKFSEPPDLTQQKYRRVSDGYIYSVIRNGFLTMPPYYETTTPTERWHIINYLRTLQEE
jgi:mono/diheme cytochrome c family protein